MPARSPGEFYVDVAVSFPPMILLDLVLVHVLVLFPRRKINLQCSVILVGVNEYIHSREREREMERYRRNSITVRIIFANFATQLTARVIILGIVRSFISGRISRDVFSCGNPNN